MQKKRPVKRVVRQQQAKKGIPPPVSPVRRAVLTSAILLVVIGLVIVVSKFMGKTSVMSTAPGPLSVASVQTVSAQDNVQTGSAAIITRAVIVPSKPASSTPLNIAYESSNPGGGPLAVTFRWYVDGTVVQDGPSSTLQPGPYRKGMSVYADVALAEQNTGSSALTTPVVVVGNGPPEVTTVVLGPENPAVGVLLSVTPTGIDPDGDPLNYTYLWRVNGKPVEAPDSESTFSTAGLKKRDSVSVLVNCTDGEASGSPVASNTVSMQNRIPKITSSAPLDLTAGRYVYQVTAKDPDGDPLSYRLDRYPAGMTIETSSGLVSWELPKGTVYTGRNEVMVAVTVNDGDGGADSQEFTLVLTDVVIN